MAHVCFADEHVLAGGGREDGVALRHRRQKLVHQPDVEGDLRATNGSQHKTFSPATIRAVRRPLRIPPAYATTVSLDARTAADTGSSKMPGSYANQGAVAMRESPREETPDPFRESATGCFTTTDVPGTA